MQAYATVGSNQIDKAVAFYDALLATIGWGKLFENPTGGRFYGTVSDGMFAVLTPYDGQPATVGNGSMAGFAFDSREAVDAFYAKVVELGGTDDGAPGERGGGSYFAYVRDLDGNKLCIWTFAPES